MIHTPTLLLADEPTGNLDSKAAKTVMELFEKINKEEKVTTMMVIVVTYLLEIKKELIFNK